LVTSVSSPRVPRLLLGQKEKKGREL